MHPTVQINLALILFLPWYAILAGLFWFYPRRPRDARRRLFDATAIVVSLVLSIVAMRWGFLTADTSVGELWKQVLATSVSYGAFLAGLTAACILRHQLLIKESKR